MLTYWETLIATRSNIAVSDSYAELWGRKLSNAYTVATYTGTLPATLTGTKAGYLESYKIYGNALQDGTPTPENPIMPSGCGERTGNLYNKTDSSMNFMGYIFFNSENYVVTASSSTSFSIIVPVEPNTTYTIVKQKTSRFRVGLFTSYPYVGETATAVYGDRDGNGIDYGTSLTFTTSNDTNYILSFIRNYDDLEATVNQMKNSTMVLRGSAVPEFYIPYGYKLPLTSAGQDVDIYIGDDTISAEEYVDSGTGKVYRRQNLYDINATDTSKGYLSGSYLYGNTIGSNPNWFVSEYMPISADTDYVVSGSVDIGAPGIIATINIYDSNKQLERYETIDNSGDTEINSGVNGAFIRTSAKNEHKNTVVVKTKNAVPTDPPVPFPRIPTAAGETTISWTGERLAPSEVELVYKVKR